MKCYDVDELAAKAGVTKADVMGVIEAISACSDDPDETDPSMMTWSGDGLTAALSLVTAAASKAKKAPPARSVVGDGEEVTMDQLKAEEAAVEPKKKGKVKWVGVGEVAKRADCSESAVNKARLSGRISADNVRKDGRAYLYTLAAIAELREALAAPRGSAKGEAAPVPVEAVSDAPEASLAPSGDPAHHQGGSIRVDAPPAEAEMAVAGITGVTPFIVGVTMGATPRPVSPATLLRARLAEQVRAEVARLSAELAELEELGAKVSP